MVDNRKITMGSMSTSYNMDPKLLMKNESAALFIAYESLKEYQKKHLEEPK